MKKILVVDESRAVRETLALILGRDFAVIQRPYLEKESLTTYSNEEVDLLIFGAPAALGGQPSVLVRIASQLARPVLFLIDSRSVMDIERRHERMDYLAKPFNPYKLKEKVVRLLDRTELPSESLRSFRPPEASDVVRYIEFPYLSASTSALAKRFSLTSLPILLLGEAGSGQERVARAICALNSSAGPWIAIYTPAIKREYLLGLLSQRFEWEQRFSQKATLFLSGVEALDASAQSALLAFLAEQEEKGWSFWLLSNSSADLLEKVYRGEFLAPLYYRLATLTLRLPPLRQRRDDLPTLAICLAQEYAKRLGIEEMSFAPGALDRLCDYLWFGNLNEMEAVIARTLATHRKRVIGPSDLVLEGVEGETSWPAIVEGESGPEEARTEETVHLQTGPQERETAVSSKVDNGNFAHSRVLINELAHELKNPMVTIKTFTHILGDRFDDATFRVRFRETVDNDIERMDGLLESLLVFSRFTQPANEKVFLYQELQRAVEEMLPDCAKRNVEIRWGGRGETTEVLADKEQMEYMFKNLLRTILEQTQPRTEIQIEVEGHNKVVFTYCREGGRVNPLTHYLGLSSTTEEEALPLRILLVKSLLERTGGELNVNYLEGGRVQIGIELPVS
jgi:DNA-binding NtrC family response regulator